MVTLVPSSEVGAFTPLKSLLAHERVPPQPCLKTNLVPPARHEPDLDQRRIPEGFDHTIVALRFRSSRVARVGFLLD